MDKGMTHLVQLDSIALVGHIRLRIVLAARGQLLHDAVAEVQHALVTLQFKGGYIVRFADGASSSSSVRRNPHVITSLAAACSSF